MNWLDIIILLVVIIYAVVGWRRGFVLLLLNLIALVAALTASLFIYGYVADWFREMGPRYGVAGFLAFIVVFLALDLLASLIVLRIYKNVPGEVAQNTVNRVFGSLLGAAKGVLVCIIALLLLTALPTGLNRKTITESTIGQELLQWGSEIERTATSVVPGDIRDSLTFITIRPQTDESVDIPRQQNISVAPEAERRMLAMLNEERVERGLQPLKMDPELREVARQHSRDMLQRGYFAHVTPDGVDPFERMRRNGIRFITAGENLALAPTVRIAHQGLMDSPGHRANILNPRYNKVGIGAYESNIGIVFSQEFTN